MKEIVLRLSLDQVNLALEALGELPFARVHQLIGAIQNQAAEQLRESSAGSAPQAGDA